jgi:hypothetical protein
MIALARPASCSLQVANERENESASWPCGVKSRIFACATRDFLQSGGFGADWEKSVDFWSSIRSNFSPGVISRWSGGGVRSEMPDKSLVSFLVSVEQEMT